ncbi:hypothetical protein ACTMU2_22985 [Cupriavidus basilensis]
MIGWLRRLFPRNAGAPHNAPMKRHVDPAEPFVINLYDDRVVVHRPDGQREEVMWDTLERVVVRVSNAAPWAGKAWLILVGAPDSGQGCVTPMDAANYGELLARVQSPAGFNHAEARQRAARCRGRQVALRRHLLEAWRAARAGFGCEYGRERRR